MRNSSVSYPSASSPRALVATALTVLCLTACADLRGTVGDLDSLPRLTAVEEARIGDVSDPDRGFSRVFQADVDRDGNLYVMEASVPEIRVFSPAGRLLRRIGGKGAGPGEMESPRFGVLGDTVWVVDGGLNRITLFDRRGTLLSTGNVERVAIPLPRSYGFLLPNLLRPDGRFMSSMGLIAYNMRGEVTGVEPTDSIPVPFILFDPSGAVTDTVGWTPRPPPRMWRPPDEDDTQFNVITVSGQRFLVPSPPTSLPQWFTLADGYIAVETPPAANPDEGSIHVTRLSLTGDTVFSRTLRYTPTRYTEENLDSIAARGARGLGGRMVAAGGSAPPPVDNADAVANRLRAEMSFPEFRLPIESSWVAQDESVWLRRIAAEGARAEWVLLGKDGVPLGTLELPADVRVLWNRGDIFWAVDPDEYDVPWVVRYRIEPA